jgi:uncharacterized delta-60 repeat protein
MDSALARRAASRPGRAAAVLLAGWVTVAGGSIARAAAGDLDPAFGGDGVVHTNFAPDSGADLGSNDEAFGLARQADGKLVAVGRAAGSGGKFALARYDTNGALDRTFGNDGRVVTNLSPGDDVALDVAIQPDGKIVAVGRTGNGNGAFALVRYAPKGRLDPTFGGDGVVTTDFTDQGDFAAGVAIQDDGKIVAVGRADSAFAVARYRPGGVLDPTFKGDGTVTTELTVQRDGAASVAIQPDGKLVVVGSAGVKAVDQDDSFWGIVRYNSTGILDPTFSDDGTLIQQLTSYGDLALDVAVRSGGEIDVAGTSGVGGFDPDARMVVMQLLPDGSRDFSFSSDSFAVENPTSRPDYPNAIAIQGDGKIVIAGTSLSINSCCMSRGVVIRFTASGAPDDTFNFNGSLLTSSSQAQSINDMLLQPDGKIVTAGRAGVTSSTFALLRFLGS